MAAESLIPQIMSEVEKLTPEQQARILDFAKHMQGTEDRLANIPWPPRSPLPPGVPGETLVALAKELNFSKEDVNDMMRAIKEGERIDWDGWQ